MKRVGFLVLARCVPDCSSASPSATDGDSSPESVLSQPTVLSGSSVDVGRFNGRLFSGTWIPPTSHDCVYHATSFFIVGH